MSSISLYRPVLGTSNKEPMKQCGGDDDEAPKGDMDRALGLSSLGFGMLAALVLAVSVGADYWLLTSEPWPTSSFTGSGGDQSSPDVATGGGSAPIGMNIPSVVMTETHSGLWQACIFAEIESASTTQATDVDQPVATISTETVDAQSAYGASEEAEYDDDAVEDCSLISYFGQGPEKIEGSETSSAIWRGIRKATPAIMVSLLLMISAEVLAVLGFLRQDFRTVVGAILSIIAALSLALGQIFYISVVNDEASQWKRPEGAKEQQTFKYGYGWAFYSAGSSFIIVMVAAVGHITVYLRRYVTNDVRRMLIIVPGLDIRKLTASSSTAAAAGTADRSSGAGLTGSSTSNSPTSPVAEEPSAVLPTENNGRIATSHVTSGSVPFIADTMTSSPGARGGIVGYRRAAFMSGLEAPLATGSQSMQSVIY